MRANDVRSTEAVRHGAYICLSATPGARDSVAAASVGTLADRLGLSNEFEPGNGDPANAIAYLRRVDARPGDITDADLEGAEAIVHVAAPTAKPVVEFYSELTRLLGHDAKPYVLSGVIRPRRFTGDAMYNFAYAHRVLQQPGPVMPNAFVVPMLKSSQWWEKGWMERHTYFLPRYDESGNMVNEGHALSSAAGIGCLMRRTYKNVVEPAPDGEYDFINHFECADDDVATYHEVCKALRDVGRNPEWSFVREGPTWHGRRVGAWPELFV